MRADLSKNRRLKSKGQRVESGVELVRHIFRFACRFACVDMTKGADLHTFACHWTLVDRIIGQGHWNPPKTFVCPR